MVDRFLQAMLHAATQAEDPIYGHQHNTRYQWKLKNKYFTVYSLQEKLQA
jgi:hypothetical protein